MRNYGEMLKEHRLEKEKTLLDIEKATGISNQNLSRWERGDVIPSIYFCEILADYYNISIDELIGRNSVVEQPKPRMIPVAARSKGNKVRNLELSEEEIRKIQASRIKKSDI